MKKTLLSCSLSLMLLSGLTAQEKKDCVLVNSVKGVEISKTAQREDFPQSFFLFKLDLQNIKSKLYTAEDRFLPNAKSAIIELPIAEGKIERFKMYEASNFEPALQAQFPDIRAYAGVGLDNPNSQIRLSISPEGISTMIFRADKPTSYMEVYSADKTIYAVYDRDVVRKKKPFTCTTEDEVLSENLAGKIGNQVMASNGKLHTFRLAMSVTGEYTTYHGGTVASALAAINTTMTRCNGVYNKDLAIHLNLIANTSNVIYTDAATDPYGATDANYNAELQATLTSVIGEANYDIGHLMSAIGNNGNAGCIGCICTNGTKGSGFTTSTAPVGDNFDIDFVVHEMGHQFGANHSFTFSGEDNAVNYEVGSGVSIMGYAGITPYDVAPHSIETYHTGNIVQIQTNILTKTCDVETNITHSAPIVNAGADFTIPKSTPFTLTGSATDAGGGSLTYQWEQYDQVNGATYMAAGSPASEAKAGGPNFRDYLPVSNGTRTFPNWTTVLALSKTTAGADIIVEALSSVARTLNFRLTVRDNVINGGQTGFDDMIVTVANKDALNVTFPATAGQSYTLGSTQTVTWSGATGTTGHQTIAGAANVDILLSTDNGATWAYTLVSGTPNDGSESITFPPGVGGAFCRFMIKASSNIFFNVSREFALGYTVTNTCNSYSNNTVLNIPDGQPGPVVTKTLNVPTSVTIADVNVTTDVTHSYMSDLIIALNHPDATQVALMNGSCGTSNGTASITFNDGAAALPTACAGISGPYSPVAPLSGFNGKTSNGTWTLLARDNFNADTGSIGNWTVEICYQTILANDSFNNEIADLSIFPNPNNGSFTINFESNTDNTDVKVFDIRGRVVFEKEYSSKGLFQQTINLNNVQSGVYLVNVKDGARQITKKIVIE